MDRLVPPAVLPVESARDRLLAEEIDVTDIRTLLEDGLERGDVIVVTRQKTFVGEFVIVSHVDGDWMATMATAHPILGVDRAAPRETSSEELLEWVTDHRAYRCTL